jgi:hypothetical protein
MKILLLVAVLLSGSAKSLSKLRQLSKSLQIMNSKNGKKLVACNCQRTTSLVILTGLFKSMHHKTPIPEGGSTTDTFKTWGYTCSSTMIVATGNQLSTQNCQMQGKQVEDRIWMWCCHCVAFQLFENDLGGYGNSSTMGCRLLAPPLSGPNVSRHSHHTLIVPVFVWNCVGVVIDQQWCHPRLPLDRHNTRVYSRIDL